MKKLLFLLLGLLCASAQAQFTPGQILTAAELNSQFALYAPLAGATFTGPVTIPSGSALTGSTIDSSVIGGSSPAAGTFTNLSATGTLSLPAASIALSRLSTEAANTVVANVTGSVASPAAFAMPSCSTSTSALQYTSGTGFACGSGFANLSGSTFTGTTSISYSNPVFIVNDTSGSNKASIYLQAGGFSEWALDNTSSSAQFSLSRYVSNSFVDNPISVSNSTGVVTMADGITGSPISGSIGSFTTLAASSTVSGTGFSTYLASPPAIGGTTPAAGKFTALQATGAVTPSSTSGIVGTTTNDNANAGSIGEYIVANTTSVTGIANNTATNILSISLTAGDWQLSGSILYLPQSGDTLTTILSGFNTTSGTSPAWVNFPYAQQGNISVGAGSGISSTIPSQRISLSGTTTVYLIGFGSHTGGTLNANGFISARRVR